MTTFEKFRGHQLSQKVSKPQNRVSFFLKKKKMFFENFIFDLVFGAMVLKKLLKIFAVFIISIMDFSFCGKQVQHNG